VRVAIDPGSVQVSPGGKVNAVVGVRNSGPVADTFLLNVDGIAADWFALGVTSLTLEPGAEETTSLVIQPPIGAKTAAGKYTATVQLTSQEDPGRRTSAPLTVVVLSAGSVTMALSPLQAQGRQAFFKAIFTNHSNADSTMVLTPDDDENALTFKMRPDDTVDVPSGESVTITVRVRPEIRRLVGQPRAYTFSLTGTYENDPFPTKIDAALTARARFTYIPRAQSLSLPNWLWYPLTLIFKLLLILAALAFIFFLLDAIATGGTKKATTQPTVVAELHATILAATLTPGDDKEAAIAGVQLTAIAQGTTVLLAAAGREDVGSITATATMTGTGKAGSKGGGPTNTKVPAAPTPSITQFTLIPSGSYVAATWQVDGATQVELNGKVVPINGAIQVPAGETVALLQAFNGKSVAQQALPVPTLSVPAADSGAASGGAAGGSGSTGDASGGSGTTGSAGGSVDAAAGTVASATPVLTSTPLPTSTPYPTSTPLPTQLPTSTLPPTATPTVVVIPTTPPPPTAKIVIPPTATASATDTATDTATATATVTATPSPSASASPSYTASPTDTATDTVTAVPPTDTATATDTATNTPTVVPDTATATNTATTVLIPTVTVVETESITGTDSITTTQIFRDTTTSSLAETPAPTASPTPTATP
jgi:hypothetical protein